MSLGAHPERPCAVSCSRWAKPGTVCVNATFGDPIIGTPKTCWTYQTTGEADEERAAEELRRWADHLNSEIQSRDERISAPNRRLAERRGAIRFRDAVIVSRSV